MGIRLQPIIIHAHIPKTAGTTFHELLQQNFGVNHLLQWSPDPLACLSLADVEEIIDQRPTLRSISSHSFRYVWREVSGRPMLPITFLRSPTEHFLSLLRYTRNEFASMPDEVKRWWPTNTSELQLRDLAKSYLEHTNRLTSTSQLCPQTRFFCPLQFTKPLLARGSTVYGHNSLRIASKTLRSFFFVGLVEEMEASIALLEKKLRRVGIDFRVSGRIWANQTVQTECLDWLNEDDCVGRKVLCANRNDECLYKNFAKRFRATSTLAQE